MSSSRFIKADAAASPRKGAFAPVLTGVSRGLQDLFPPVELPRTVRSAAEDERNAVTPVQRQRQAPEPRPA